MTAVVAFLFVIVAALQGYAVGYGYLGLSKEASWERAVVHAWGAAVLVFAWTVVVLIGKLA